MPQHDPSAAPSSIRALLLDVEGVIAVPDDRLLDARLRAFAPGVDARALYAARNTARTYALWEAYSCGRLGKAEYWGPVLDELGLAATPDAIDLLSAAERDAWWAVLDADVLALASRARRIVSTGLLSNSAPEHEAHLPRFAGRFDIVCFSHRVGLRKPDPAAYLEAARRFGLDPDQIAFVDDKARNVDAANALGMFGIRFESASALEAELRAAGVALAPADAEPQPVGGR